jgi:N-acetylmuramoyl-L-alanine amidase
LVLRATSMPSVLIETGYLSNQDEDAFLSSTTGQDQMASAIFLAFKDYKTQMELGSSNEPPAAMPVKQKKPTPKPTPKPVKPDPKLAVKPAEKADTKLIQSATENTKPIFTIFLQKSSDALKTNEGNFAALAGVRKIKRGEVYYYYVGKFDKESDALKLIPDLKNLGFKNAKVEPVN